MMSKQTSKADKIMKTFLSKYPSYSVSRSNSYIATTFAVVVTALLVGGYEASHVISDAEFFAVPPTTIAQPAAVVRMDTIVVTAKRG